MSFVPEPFVGRVELLERLKDVIERGNSFWIYGSAGQGKSSLLRRLAGITGGRVISVIDEGGHQGLLRALYELNPQVDPLPEDLDDAAIAGLAFAKWCQAHQGSDGPIFIDDWDKLSRVFQAHGLRSVVAMRPGIGIASRGSARSVLPRDQWLGLTQCLVADLSEAEQFELARQHFERSCWPDGLGLFDAVRTEVCGAPLLVKTLLGGLDDWRAEGGRPDPKHHERVWAIRRGADEAYLSQLLAGASVEEIEELRLLVHLPEPIVPAPLRDRIEGSTSFRARETWLQRGLLIDEGGRYRFLPSVKSVLKKRLALTQTAERLQLVACLEAGFFGEDAHHYLLPLVEQVGHLAGAASPLVDERLRAVVGAVDEGFENYLVSGRHEALATALETWPQALLKRYPLVRCRLAQALFFNDKSFAAMGHFDALRGSKDPRIAKLILGYIQNFDFNQGQVDEVLGRYRKRYDEGNFTVDDLSWLAFYVTTLWRLQDLAGVREVAHRGQMLAQEVGNPRYRWTFLAYLGMGMVAEGDLEEGFSLQRRACDALAEGGYVRSEAVSRYRLVEDYLQAGECELALEHIDRVLELFRSWNASSGTVLRATLLKAECLVQSGRIEAFEELLDGIDEVPLSRMDEGATGDLSRLRAFRQRLKNTQKDRSKERRLLHRAFVVATGLGKDAYFLPALYAYAGLLLDEGDLDEVYRVAVECRELRISAVVDKSTRHMLGQLALLRGDLTEANQKWALPSLGEDAIFPRPSSAAFHPLLEAWCGQWEVLFDVGPRRAGMLEGSDENWTGSAALAHLYQGWKVTLIEGNRDEARRHGWLARAIGEGEGVFAFLQGLLEVVVSEESTPWGEGAHRSMFRYWLALPDELLTQQLGAWGRRALRMKREGVGELERATGAHLEEVVEWVTRWRVDGALIIDRSRGEVYVDGRTQVFNPSAMPFLVLCALGETSEIIGIPELYEGCWGLPYYADSSKNTVYTTVNNLRRALGEDGKKAPFIEQIRGTGYRLLRPAIFVNES